MHQTALVDREAPLVMQVVRQIHLPSVGEVLIFAYGFAATSC